jgi:hypothetical protein
MLMEWALNMKVSTNDLVSVNARVFDSVAHNVSSNVCSSLTHRRQAWLERCHEWFAWYGRFGYA